MDTQFSGESLTKNGTIHVPQACQGLCQEKAECEFFTWSETNCELWKTQTTHSAKDGYISGPKNCRKCESICFKDLKIPYIK